MSLRTRIVLVIVTLLITGCKSIGPRQITLDRSRYNNIVRATDHEQLLKNIVRLRYLETTFYVQVSNLTASYALSRSLTASNDSSQLLVSNWRLKNLGLTSGVNYTDNPTISYVPLSNSTFVTSLLVPVSLLNIHRLFHAGTYDAVTLFRMFFEKIGDFDCRLVVRGGSLIVVPRYERYSRFFSLLQKMIRNGSIMLPGAVKFNNRIGFALQFQKNIVHSPDALKLKKMLHVPLPAKIIYMMEQSDFDYLHIKNGELISDNERSKPSNVVYVQLRSLNGILAVLAHGVQIPEQDVQAKLTQEVVDIHGKRMTWYAQMKDYMIIYSSDKEPKKNVLVKTYVNHHWFYIKSTDEYSKMTFAAVVRLQFLTSVTPTELGAAPVLTLPVSASRG